MLPWGEEDPYANIGVADVVINMMMVYNAVLHSGIYILNVGIIWKEEMMLIFQGAEWISGPESRYALTWKNAREELWDDLWIFDPFRFVPRIYALIFKARLGDELAKNPYIGIDY